MTMTMTMTMTTATSSATATTMMHLYARMLTAIVSFIAITRSNALSANSLLANTRWNVKLDVGLQPGTWMPKRYPGWAESGARLGLDLDIQFTDVPSRESEILVGPSQLTYELDVVTPTCTFVSERGQEAVTFGGGGWCIQRPNGDVRNENGAAVCPEGLLRFWLDCKTGAKRRDVEILPNTRIFFTTGVWDRPGDVAVQKDQYQETVTEMENFMERTRSSRSRRENQSVMERILSLPKQVDESKQLELLMSKKMRLEREMPPPQSPQASNGVQIASTGSLVIKGKESAGWLPGSEYLILGTFSTAARTKW